jgi:hypothetical protein
MACNPKVQYNDFEGNNVQTDYTFTFPYINTTDVEVRLGSYPNYTYPDQTEYTVDDANPTVLTFNVAPTGPFRIFRCTYDQALEATFQSGSAIRASDLNANFEQMLFIVQDANIRSLTAQETADLAYEIATEAIRIANEALDKAEEALEKASLALELVQEQVIGEVVPDIPSLPADPIDGNIYTVVDSTGVENLVPTPISMPAGFEGSAEVSVKLLWNGSAYQFLEAYARDPDARYVLNNSPIGQYSVRFEDTWVDADTRYANKTESDDKFLCKDFSIYPLLTDE